VADDKFYLGNNNFSTKYMTVDNSTGHFGFGITPEVRLHARVDDATTNAVTNLLKLTHTTSGTPANGIGVGMQFEVETSANNNEIGATIEAVASDVTSTSEDFYLSLKTMIAGAAATEVARFDGSTTAGDTRFLIYDVDNGTLERVTVGAADSGGTGYKLLRIPN
jgi:hypothetical protein